MDKYLSIWSAGLPEKYLLPNDIPIPRAGDMIWWDGEDYIVETIVHDYDDKRIEICVWKAVKS